MCFMQNQALTSTSSWGASLGLLKIVSLNIFSIQLYMRWRHAVNEFIHFALWFHANAWVEPLLSVLCSNNPLDWDYQEGMLCIIININIVMNFKLKTGVSDGQRSCCLSKEVKRYFFKWKQNITTSVLSFINHELISNGYLFRLVLLTFTLVIQTSVSVKLYVTVAAQSLVEHRCYNSGTISTPCFSCWVYKIFS